MNQFWKEGIVYVIVLSLIPLLPFSLMLVGFILALNNTEFWIMVYIGMFLWVISIIPLFLPNTYSKIIISKDGIGIKYRNKIRSFYNWESITDVTTSYSGYTLRYLTFISDDSKINVELNLKLYKTILKMCTNEYIKSKVQAMPEIQSRINSKKHKKF